MPRTKPVLAVRAAPGPALRAQGPGGAPVHTIYSPRHAAHAGNVELNSGAIVPAFEKPARAEMVLARVEAVGLGPIWRPGSTTSRSRGGCTRRTMLTSCGGRGRSGSGRPQGSAMPFVWPVPGCGRQAPDRHRRAARVLLVGCRRNPRRRHLGRRQGEPGRGGDRRGPGGRRRARRLRALPPARAPRRRRARWAATATSTTPRSRPRRCASTARHGWRSSTSTTTTATAPKRSSTPAPTCWW